MINYEGAVFRPPSEAKSLIIQATIGCSHNKCSFCSMYKEKEFRLRDFSDIEKDLKVAKSMYSHIKRIFLADGDALIMSTKKLTQILEAIKSIFPECERVGIYGTSKSINIKTKSELDKLKSLGLGIIYLGLESGNDEILFKINKGERACDIVKAGIKAKESNILVSVTAISGLGGQDLKTEHALDTARSLSLMNPDYIGFLSLMIEPNTGMWNEFSDGSFKILTAKDIIEEMIIFLKNIDSPGTIFRSNHASNYFSLYGNLNEDIPLMLQELYGVIKDEDLLKHEFMRRL